MLKGVLLLVFTLLSAVLFGQRSQIEGSVRYESQGLAFATVGIPELNLGVTTDLEGRFYLEDLDPGTYELVVRNLGYSSKTKTVSVKEGERLELNFDLNPDLINLEGVVVSGSRSELMLSQSPVIVSQINNQTFERTQALSLSEGLSFSPGLRLENNCANCGFTQLRMNGLEGAYSQILVNSRPIFSALLGVYGLDLIPANMIDRVEVVRGGGSVLYGGNAIAGTVNIITKDALENSLEIGFNQALINGEASDRSYTLNGALVSEDLKKGINFYGFNRNRDYWDANGDGISEITLLENNTLGLDAYLRPSDRSRIEFNGFAINEFRRGGNKFDLEPHQTDITEQLDHRIYAGALSYELFSKDYLQKISIYTSAQKTNRDSYYGGGGRVLEQGDSLSAEDVLAINAYGVSEDIALAGGIQYSFTPNKIFGITIGSEVQYNDVTDEMPGYSRVIEQDVKTWGNYFQLDYGPLERLRFLLGGRYDLVEINGLYDFGIESFDNQRDFGVFVPRASVMYDASKNLKLRASFAQGYRAPQAFNEDLHIETVGGAAVFVQLDPNLEMETSNSLTASLNYAKTSDRVQLNYLVEGFYTVLNNPFITSNQRELDNGVALITKRNGSGASVQGLNFELNAALDQKWILNSGFTVQSARYKEEEEVWSPELASDSNRDSLITTRNLLRTPDYYGYFSLTYNPKRWSFTASGVYTGPMDLPHVIDPETEFTIIERSQSFLELNLKATRIISFGEKGGVLKVFAGIQNLSDSFQSDFDIGPQRDAGYVYGPTRPRTIFFGVKWGL